MRAIDRTFPATLTAVLLAWALPAFAWGPIGHRTVGLVAEHHLSPEARSKVAELIGPESLAQVSTWADEIRSEPAWDRASPWHWVTIPDGETYATAPKAPGGDIIEAMRRFEGVLRDPQASREDRQVALKFLVHFVGDVHQPLHVGRGGDQGGNAVLVLWFGKPSNLHRVWDSDIIDLQQLSFTELTSFIDHPTPEQVATWQSSGYLDWVAESMALRDQVYDLGDRRLGYDYAHRNWPTIEHRLLQAGVRLAGLLESIFGGGKPVPAPPAH